MKADPRAGVARKYFTKLAKKYKLIYKTGENANLILLRQLIKAKFIIIVEYYIYRHKEAHYSIVKKISRGSIYFLDPWFGPRHKYRLAYFNRVWRDGFKKNSRKKWYFAVRYSK